MDDLESFFSDVKQAEADATEATVAPMPVAVSSTIVAKPRGSSQIAGAIALLAEQEGVQSATYPPAGALKRGRDDDAPGAPTLAPALRAEGTMSAPAVMPPPPPLPVDDARKHLPEGLTSHEGSLFLQQQSVYDHEAQARLASSLHGASSAGEVSWASDGRGGGGGGGGAGAASKPKKYVRRAEGKTWEDPSLAGWPENDYRLFVGDLGNEVTDDVLANTFHQCARARAARSPRACRAVHDRPPPAAAGPGRYASLAKAKVVRDKHTNKSKVLRSRANSAAKIVNAAACSAGLWFRLVPRPVRLRESSAREERQIHRQPTVQAPQIGGASSSSLPRLRLPLSSSALSFAVAGTADRRSTQEGAPGQEDAKSARAPVRCRATRALPSKCGSESTAALSGVGADYRWRLRCTARVVRGYF